MDLFSTLWLSHIEGGGKTKKCVQHAGLALFNNRIRTFPFKLFNNSIGVKSRVAARYR
jgi:hypothetical protein